MRFSSIAVGIASVLGHLATASPANELAERSSAAANSYLVKEGLFSYESILKALGNTGSNAPGTAAGLLIASPNTENPDCMCQPEEPLWQEQANWIYSVL
jgi:glucoamylase